MDAVFLTDRITITTLPNRLTLYVYTDAVDGVIEVMVGVICSVFALNVPAASTLPDQSTVMAFVRLLSDQN